MEEQWKEVPGYEEHYEVSNHGRVRSIARILTRNNADGTVTKLSYKSKVKKPSLNEYGYEHYGLHKDGKGKTITAHRLVALAWLPNPNNLPVVHHKDHNKRNNNIQNLEWSTFGNNTREAIKFGNHRGGFRTGSQHHMSKFTDKQVKWVFKLRNEYGLSLRAIADIINSSKPTVGSMLNKKSRVAHKPDDKLVYCKIFPVYTVCPVPNF